MSVHPRGCTCGKYACELRAKGVQVSPAATPSSSNKDRTAPDNARYNGWERGIAGEDRPGGTRMPYIDKNGSPIGIKPFTEGKFRKGQERLQRQRAQSAAS